MPENDMSRFGFVASLMSDKVPLMLPVDLGAKLRVNCVLCEESKTSGNLSPVRLKPGVDNLACETLTGAPPTFVTVMNADCVTPTGTLPNRKVAELEIN